MNDSAIATLVDFGKVAYEAAQRLAAETDLTTEQALQAVHSGALMLVNGTLYGGLNK